MDLDSFSATPSSLGRAGDVITPSNDDLAADVKGVVCLTAGNITIVPFDNDDADTLAFVDAPTGFVPPYRVRRVTAATAIVASIVG